MATTDTATTIRKLRARVRALEAILKCVECGHLRSEHDDGDSPCYGGRTGLAPGEGDYCMCSGFVSEQTRTPTEGKPND